jgi:hypothetical protein
MKKNAWLILGLIGAGMVSHAGQAVHGKRYCEIVYSKDYIDFFVYSTHSVNDCPVSWWKTLNQKVLTKHLGASYVFLNGPRIWVADEISNFNPGDKVTINGSPLPQVASFHSNLQSLLQRHGPFVDYKVKRQQVYHFHPGSKIYELVSPKGQVYVLHSISLKHRSQSLTSLDSLASSIHLPKGWQFKSGTIAQEFKLMPQNQNIHVVMDELDNTYQLAEKNPL